MLRVGGNGIGAVGGDHLGEVADAVTRPSLAVAGLLICAEKLLLRVPRENNQLVLGV
ncbi:MAG: hypothetical protein ACJ8C4_10635 [Gemmataceae bacterium]